MAEPIIIQSSGPQHDPTRRLAATGQSFSMHEWRGSGPATLHVHHNDDEAWHVLEGTLRFRFADGITEAGPGATVFIPAGVPHTYEAAGARYLIILTPRLVALIADLQRTPDRSAHPEIYRRHDSELLE